MKTLLPQKVVNHGRGTGLAGLLAAAVLLALLAPRPAAAQGDGLHLSGGLGLPELIHGGLHYRTGLFEIGGSFGFVALGDNQVTSAGGDLFYHLGGRDQFGNAKPWYLRAGAYYMRDEGDDLIHRYVYLNTRVGRDFVLSEKFLMKLDAGVLTQLFHEEIEKDSFDSLFDGLDIDLPILPSIGVKILYRF